MKVPFSIAELILGLLLANTLLLGVGGLLAALILSHQRFMRKRMEALEAAVSEANEERGPRL